MLGLWLALRQSEHGSGPTRTKRRKPCSGISPLHQQLQRQPKEHSRIILTASRGLEGVSLQDKSARYILKKGVEKVELLAESDDWAQELLRDTGVWCRGSVGLAGGTSCGDLRMGQQDPQSRCLVHFGWLARTARCDSHGRQRSLQEHQSVSRENSGVEEKQAGFKIHLHHSSYPSSPDRSVPEGTAAA